jgi:hypothetical protein
MKRSRKWLLTALVAVALLLPLASVVSADPGDGGFGFSAASARVRGQISTLADPGDGGFGP